MLKWTTTSESSSKNGVKCLVYGDSGIGKTRLCATAPNPLILSCEKGLLSVREYDIPVLQIDSIQDMDDAYTFITTDKDYMQHIETICIDSLTELAEIILAEAMAAISHGLQAYGEMAERVTELVKKWRDIEGFNVVFTAQQQYFIDEANKVGMFLPSMPGKKLGPKLPYWFDEVFAMKLMADENGKQVPIVQTEKDFQYKAKDRSGALATAEYPDLSNIFTKILGDTANG